MEITLKVEARELAQSISKLADAINNVKGLSLNTPEITKPLLENINAENEASQSIPDEKPIRKKRSSSKVKKDEDEPVKEAAEKADSIEQVELPKQDEPTEQDLFIEVRDRLIKATADRKIKQETVKNTLAKYGYRKLSDIPLDKLKDFEEEVMA